MMMNGSNLARLREIEIDPLHQAIRGFKALSPSGSALYLAELRGHLEEWLLEGVSPGLGSALTVASGLACAALAFF